MWSRARVWSLSWLLALGCGSTGKHDQPPPVPPIEGAAGSAGAPRGPSAEETAAYRYGECGRIEPSAYIRATTYASDGSVVMFEATGRVRLFPTDSNVATTLIPDQGVDTQAPSPLAISPDGVWLLLGGWVSGGPTVYAREDRAPIVAGTSDLVAVDTVDAEAESCVGRTHFALDSVRVATSDLDTACIWESITGALLASFALEANEEPLLLPAEALGAEGFLAVRNDTLLSFDLLGELAASFDLTPLVTTTEKSVQTSFSSDGRYLALQFYDTSLGMSRLVIVDTKSGAVAWQHVIRPTSSQTGSFVISPDASALLMSKGPLLRLSDGSEIGSDVPDLFNGTPVLAPGAQRLLRIGEQIAEWDLERQELMRLYGSHSEAIRDLDISPDGRHFASHGGRAVTWALDAQDFSQSLPLFRGAAPDESWNVALDPSGEVMSVSGDNVGFFKRHGGHESVGLPPAAVGCLSADWSFSPLGGVAAGTHYGPSVVVVDTANLSSSGVVEASNCGGGVAFSPDGSLLATASRELFDTATWTRLYGAWPTPGSNSFTNAEGDVVFSPDGAELVITRCAQHNQECVATRYHTADGSEIGRVPRLTGEQVRFSPDGDWLISRNQLVHLPSGANLELPAAVAVAVFTPEGDIISGEADGSLVRHCRAE
jgi:WD40 repeat protein